MVVVVVVLERERGGKGKDGEGLGEFFSLESLLEESFFLDSDEDLEMERIIVGKVKKWESGGSRDKVKLFDSFVVLKKSLKSWWRRRDSLLDYSD